MSSANTERAPNLARTLGASAYDRLLALVTHDATRRLSTARSVQVRTGDLVQSVRIDRMRGPAVPQFGQLSGGLVTHSLETVHGGVEEILQAGLRAVFLQPGPSHPGMESQARIDFFCRVIDDLKIRYGHELFVILDPQGLCMDMQTLRWGVTGAAGGVDPLATLELLYKGARAAVLQGCDAFTTIGRVNGEAAVARSAIDSTGRRVGLYAFSTNCETPNAYFNTETINPKAADTGQKILVGNLTEMLLRACADIYEGVDIVVQKPLENLAVLRGMREIIATEGGLDRFLLQPDVQDLLDANHGLLPTDALGKATLRERIAGAALGTYEVSGTYCTFKLIEQRFGTAIAHATLSELLLNAYAAAGNRLRWLVGRNMTWFASTLGQAGLLTRSAAPEPAGVHELVDEAVPA